MRKELVIGLILVAVLVGFLEWRNAPVEQAIRNDPPPRISKMIYPCETWIRQSGGSTPPVFSCVNAIRDVTHSDKGKP